MPKKRVRKKTKSKTRSRVRKKFKSRKRVRKKIKSRKKVRKKFKSRKKVKIVNTNDPNEFIIKTKPEWIKASLTSKTTYQKKYTDSIKNNEGFWKKEGRRITWIKPYKKIKDIKYSKEEVRIKWFEDGTLNASANCIDRHLKDK